MAVDGRKVLAKCVRNLATCCFHTFFLGGRRHRVGKLALKAKEVERVAGKRGLMHAQRKRARASGGQEGGGFLGPHLGKAQ